jgi:translocation and assembly module TamA
VDAVPLPRPRALFAAALLALSVTGCASARPPPGPKVNELEIQGTEAVGEGDIKAKIVTTDTPWYEPFWPFDEPRYFDANAWQADLRRIERFYEAEGYYQAEVLDSEVRPHGEKAVDLHVRVREGPPTTIASIEYRGFEALPEEHRQRALASLPLVKGEIFRELDWEGVKGSIQERLRELGYAEAEVQGSVTVDLATRQATVLVQAEPGKRYRFGNTFVATDANPKVNHRRVIEQAQGAVRKGAWYSESALVDAQARVFRMGVFGAVKVNRGAPDREAGTVPVVVDVSEAPFHSLRAGGGVGIENRRQEARVLAEYTDRNFFGGLRRFTLRARAGYAFIPGLVGSDEAGPIANVTAELEQPRFLFRDVRAQNSLTFERGLEEGYNFDSGRLKTGVVWQPRRYFSIAPSYNLELVRLKTKDRAALLEGTAPALAFGCTEATADCLITLSYLEQIIAWDRRDDVSEPRSGYYAALNIQEAGSLLQGDFTYLRLLPELRYYHSFGDEQRLTFAGRVRAGRLFPFGQDGREPQSPIVTRFFSGGDQMRGFSSRRLSPMLAQVRPDRCMNPETGALGPRRNLDTGLPEDCDLGEQGDRQRVTFVPIGGETLLETSLEVRYRITESVVLASFYDMGRVTAPQAPLLDASGERLDTVIGGSKDVLQHAVGLGLRYLTLIGPIRLDIAYRPPIGGPLRVFGRGPPAGVEPVPERGDLFEQYSARQQSDTSCFGLFGKKGFTYPGAPEGRCSLHISIGEAF